MTISNKKFSLFFTGKSVVQFFQKITFETIFEKYSKKCDFGKKSKGISLEKMKIFFLVRFSRKIEGDF